MKALRAPSISRKKNPVKCCFDVRTRGLLT